MISKDLFYTKYPNFDWKFYIESYDDLKKANIDTEQKAIDHYYKYGYNENRRTHNIIKDESLDKIEFSIFLKMTSQLYVSKGLHMFEERFKKKYNLKCLENTYEPSMFFGIYTDEDIERVKNHKGLRIIIWGGEDANPNNSHSLVTLKEIKCMHNIIHLSISKCMYNRLKKMNINSIYVNFNITDHSLFYPIPKNERGNKILIFNGQQPGREHIYGEKIYKLLVEKLPYYEYIYTNTLNKKYEEMPAVYKQCFIVLRLTEYDGNSNTSQECESMKIPIVHNQSDYGLKWNSIEDIINHIEECYKHKNL